MLTVAVLLSASCERKNDSVEHTTALVTTLVEAKQAISASGTPVITAPAAAAISDKVQGSCSIMGLSCSDYQGDASPTVLKATCEKYSGKWSNGPCPRDKIQGICTKLEAPFRNITYTYPPGTAETARTACTNTPGGVFSTP
jgi:phage tail sheath gpL-like